jgi:hypothetical protein
MKKEIHVGKTIKMKLHLSQEDLIKNLKTEFLKIKRIGETNMIINNLPRKGLKVTTNKEIKKKVTTSIL